MEATREGQEAAVWLRRRDETPVAYAAFVCYRDLGVKRTVVGVARELGKSESLLRRWARRHDWAERAWAWDLSQAQDAEAVMRAGYREALRRQFDDADGLRRLAMAKFSGLVRRDPVSGELGLDPAVTVSQAISICKLSLEMRRDMRPVLETAVDEEQPRGQLPEMTDRELIEVIALAKERAQGKTEGDHDADDTEAIDERAVSEG
jgi:hypothetical protein